MSRFKEKFGEFRKGLLRINDKEPLTGLAIVVVIFLDLFVLNIIFGGLGAHTDQLTSPEEYLPSAAKSVFIDQDWSGVDRLARLQQLALVDYSHYSYTYKQILDDRKIAKMHPRARMLYQDVKSVVDDPSVKTLFIKRQTIVREIQKLNADFRSVQPVRDSNLLSQTAKSSNLNLDAVESRSQTRSQQLDQKYAELDKTDRALSAHPLVLKVWKTIDPDNEPLKKQMIRDFRIYQIKYRFIEFFWQLMFLLPLLFVINLWYNRSLKKGAGIQSLIGSHLLVVTSIPILLKAVELVLELIPKYLFKRIFEILEALHIIALWHYLVIVVAILSALVLIYIIQKKIFNRESLYRARLEQNRCYSCGRRLPHVVCAHCPHCGENQTRNCSDCGKTTPAAGSRCTHCGR